MTAEFMQEMLVLYSVALAGFISRKKGVLNEHADNVLTKLILYITLPALILYSLDIPFSSSHIQELFWLVVMSIYILTISIIFARWQQKRSKLPVHQRKVYESLIIFGNQGFIGYAVVFILFQEAGIVYLTMFNICYLILIWTYGIYLFTTNKQMVEWKRIFLNPGIISTGLGLVFLFSPLTFPAIAADSLDLIGKMTIPLSMIVIGSLMAKVTLKDIPLLVKNTYLWKMTFFRLLLLPLLIIVFIFLPVPIPLLMIAVIVSGMPAAPTISLYAQTYGGDAFFAALGVFLTTLLCILTVPLLYFLVNVIASNISL
ncbi:AEC family transporter [Virgibacillus sp. W0181]|uniref:AEC family transporter n=1 Tax=Virgibacillus sp. W0181 TaxID=3391581 RepID=UPI003F46EBCF